MRARHQNICSPVLEPVQPYRSDCPCWRVGTLTSLCQIDACTFHDWHTQATPVPPTRQAMRFLALISLHQGDAGRKRRVKRNEATYRILYGNSPTIARKTLYTFDRRTRPKPARTDEKTLYTSDIEYFLHFGKTESVRKSTWCTQSVSVLIMTISTPSGSAPAPPCYPPLRRRQCR